MIFTEKDPGSRWVAIPEEEAATCPGHIREAQSSKELADSLNAEEGLPHGVHLWITEHGVGTVSKRKAWNGLNIYPIVDSPDSLAGAIAYVASTGNTVEVQWINSKRQILETLGFTTITKGNYDGIAVSHLYPDLIVREQIFIDAELYEKCQKVLVHHAREALRLPKTPEKETKEVALCDWYREILNAYWAALERKGISVKYINDKKRWPKKGAVGAFITVVYAEQDMIKLRLRPKYSKCVEAFHSKSFRIRLGKAIFHYLTWYVTTEKTKNTLGYLLHWVKTHVTNKKYLREVHTWCDSLETGWSAKLKADKETENNKNKEASCSSLRKTTIPG